MYFNISTKKSPLFKGTHLPHFTTTSIPQPRDPKPCETMGNPNAGLFVFSPKILRWPTVAMKFKLDSLVFDPRRLSREYRSKHFWRLQIYDFLHFFWGGGGIKEYINKNPVQFIRAGGTFFLGVWHGEIPNSLLETSLTPYKPALNLKNPKPENKQNVEWCFVAKRMCCGLFGH